MDKKQLRQLYRKFGQCVYYTYGEGVGNYNDFEKITETFYETAPDNYIRIHRHRNTKQLPVMVNDKVYNLEGQVEFGGCLRCVQVDREGIRTVEVKNEVFKTPEMQQEQTVIGSSIADTIIALRSNRYIQEKKFGEFFDWYYDVLEEDYEYGGRKIEGFVIEDSTGYMTKLKLAYYNFWKFMRGVAQETIRKGHITRTSTLTTPTANAFYGWVKKLHDVEDRDSVPKDICTLRTMF